MTAGKSSKNRGRKVLLPSPVLNAFIGGTEGQGSVVLPLWPWRLKGKVSFLSRQNPWRLKISGPRDSVV